MGTIPAFTRRWARPLLLSEGEGMQGRASVSWGGTAAPWDVGKQSWKVQQAGQAEAQAGQSPVARAGWERRKWEEMGYGGRSCSASTATRVQVLPPYLSSPAPPPPFPPRASPAGPEGVPGYGPHCPVGGRSVNGDCCQSAVPERLSFVL